MKFEQEHMLPLLAVHATWVAVQTGMINSKGKPLTIEKLLGKKGTGKDKGPMTRSAMMSEALMLKEFHDRKMVEKKEKEDVS